MFWVQALIAASESFSVRSRRNLMCMTCIGYCRPHEHAVKRPSATGQVALDAFKAGLTVTLVRTPDMPTIKAQLLAHVHSFRSLRGQPHDPRARRAVVSLKRIGFLNGNFRFSLNTTIRTTGISQLQCEPAQYIGARHFNWIQSRIKNFIERWLARRYQRATADAVHGTAHCIKPRPAVAAGRCQPTTLVELVPGISQHKARPIRVLS